MLESRYAFYPTPKPVIAKMLAPYYKIINGKYYLQDQGRFILEPSAGKGDILDYLVGTRYRGEKLDHVFAIEIQPELQAILHEKGYHVVESDFLAYTGTEYFNFVIMNPPFHEGVKHVLHAWNLLPEGDLVALLNAETLKNPYTFERQQLGKLLEEHQLQPPEYLSGAFENAERKTNVESVIIWLHKETSETLPPFDYTRFDHDHPLAEEEFSTSPLAHFDRLETLVAQYNASVQTIKDIHMREKWLRFYMQEVADTTYEAKKAPQTLNEKLAQTKQAYWKYVFEKTKLGQVVTSEFKKKFAQFQATTEHIAFTSKNIREILEMFFLNQDMIMQECLLQVFDDAIKYHAKNTVRVEGWKTNKSYKVAKKIIMPRGLSYEAQWQRFSLTWTNTDFYRDLDLVMCMLSGKKIEQIASILDTLQTHFSRMENTRWGRDKYEAAYNDPLLSTFFKIKIFKKGTVHLEFLDETLWQDFNLKAAQGKGWQVGPGY